MPSFLSKVFGRKKEPDQSRPSNGSLLDGKFEAVTASPTAEKFLSKDAPHLSIALPPSKELSAFSVQPEPVVNLKGRRLTLAETLQIVKACSTSIQAHGLETLGLMRPNWHSASSSTQQKLISRFFSNPADFAGDLDSASPHDVAAVFRWALRRLKLDSNSFGKAGDWYTQFFQAEKNDNYPPRAFSDKLVPLLPDEQNQLLHIVLDLTSSLSAHSEANGVSGSKFSKLVGFWLLMANPVRQQESWLEFYTRWDTTGRMLEHIFLCRIRDEASRITLPRRLTELVVSYPYAKSGTLSTFLTSDDNSTLLPRPRFTTRHYQALFVRVESESVTPEQQLPLSPLKVLNVALSAPPSSNEWDQIKTFAKDDSPKSPKPADQPFAYERILGDETLDLLGVRPMASSPITDFHFLPPSISATTSTTTNGTSLLTHTVSPSTDSAISSPPPLSKEPSSAGAQPSGSDVGLDWAHFSTSGFFGPDAPGSGSRLASTLMDKDVEVTTPKANLTKSSSKRGRKSHEAARPLAPLVIPEGLPTTGTNADQKLSGPTTDIQGKVVKSERVLIDEAFVDFWTDALQDPDSMVEWPAFVLCKVAPSAVPVPEEDGEEEKKHLEYVVIEHAYVAPPPPPAPAPRTVSPSPSKTSASSNVGSSKKRFGLWSSSASKRKGSKKESAKDNQHVKIGEMGEILEDSAEDKTKDGVKDVAKEKDGKEAKSPDDKNEVKPGDKATDAKDDSPVADNNSNGVGTAVAAGVAGAVVGAVGAAVAVEALSGDKSAAAEASEEPVPSAEPTSQAIAEESKEAEPAAPVTEGVVVKEAAATAVEPVTQAAAAEVEAAESSSGVVPPVESAAIAEAASNEGAEPAEVVPQTLAEQEPDLVSTPLAKEEPVQQPASEPVEPTTSTEPASLPTEAEGVPTAEATIEPSAAEDVLAPPEEPVPEAATDASPAEPVHVEQVAAPEQISPAVSQDPVPIPPPATLLAVPTAAEEPVEEPQPNLADPALEAIEEAPQPEVSGEATVIKAPETREEPPSVVDDNIPSPAENVAPVVDEVNVAEESTPAEAPIESAVTPAAPSVEEVSNPAEEEASAVAPVTEEAPTSVDNSEPSAQEIAAVSVEPPVEPIAEAPPSMETEVPHEKERPAEEPMVVDPVVEEAVAESHPEEPAAEEPAVCNEELPVSAIQEAPVEEIKQQPPVESTAEEIPSQQPLEDETPEPPAAVTEPLVKEEPESVDTAPAPQETVVNEEAGVEPSAEPTMDDKPAVGVSEPSVEDKGETPVNVPSVVDPEVVEPPSSTVEVSEEPITAVKEVPAPAEEGPATVADIAPEVVAAEETIPTPEPSTATEPEVPDAPSGEQPAEVSVEPAPQADPAPNESLPPPTVSDTEAAEEKSAVNDAPTVVKEEDNISVPPADETNGAAVESTEPIVPEPETSKVEAAADSIAHVEEAKAIPEVNDAKDAVNVEPPATLEATTEPIDKSPGEVTGTLEPRD